MAPAWGPLGQPLGDRRDREAVRVERAAKRLVDEVKVSGLVFCWCMYTLLLVHCVIRILLAGCNENSEVPKKVL